MKPRRKSIWVCGSCGKGYSLTTRKDATQCCVCPGCGAPNPTAGGGRVFCRKCTAASDLTDQRQRLESAINNHAFAVRKAAAAGVDFAGDARYATLQGLPF